MELIDKSLQFRFLGYSPREKSLITCDDYLTYPLHSSLAELDVSEAVKN